MLRKISLLALVCCLLCAVASAETAEFAPLHFSLWADTAANYEWSCEYIDNGVLEAPMEDFIEMENGGTQEYYFGVKQPGQSRIIFNYGENWNLNAPCKTIICSVDVDESGNSSIRRTESFADDRILQVELPANPTTGWDWSYQEENGSLVSLVSREYTPIAPDLEGAGGTLRYQFRVEKSGETLLLFNYSSLWDPAAAAAETYAVILSVSDDMEISFNVDEQ